MSVKVAVRVRPFNSREIELQSELCLDVKDKTTIITDKTSGNTREFSFDYSFWSHDCFDTTPDGLYVANSDKYADQQFVFQKVGIEILDNAWLGYHCCLFAYGQTGAGKSYSMVGYGPNKGIVPISCEEIFARINKNDNPNKEFQIQFSMLEIYNEKIQDLLIPINKRPQGGLKVREHKTLGVYVEDLTKHPVDSYESIESKMEEGNRNRTIGSTLMNASSSRAHTIITIEFRQIDTIDKRKSEKLSVINLVDLAGSEKLSKTGATGDRMKEGCAINKSLTILGIVISSLAEKSSGKKNVIIPYRDSALTRILQNALGGNSKTLMICALSPATNNYDETLSTLRYADQAKKIKLHAVVNESEQDKMIRELREENEKLRDILKSFSIANNPQAILSDPNAMEKIKDMEEQLKANAMLMQEYEKSFEQRLKEAKEKESEDYQIDYTKPFVMNLNEDPVLNGKINYSLMEDIVYIGRKNGNPPPKIVLGGMGIKQNHAFIRNDNGKIFIEPQDKECGEYIYLNGTKVYSQQELHHNDRLIFGTNTAFLVKIPGENMIEQEVPMELDWEFAQKELMSKLEKNKKLEFEQYEQAKSQEVTLKVKAVEEQLKKEKVETELLMVKQKEEYEQKLKELESKIQSGGGNLEQEKSQAKKEMMENVAKIEADINLKEKESEKKKQEIKFKDKHYLERKLSKYLPKILEINLIAKELKKNVSLNAKLTYTFKEGIDFSKNELSNAEDDRTKFKILIQVMNREYGYVFYWEVSKFSNRYYVIKDILERYFETNELPKLTKEEDPFWDPPEPHLIGQSFLKLMSLAYVLDYSCELALVGEKGACGSLNVKVIPTDEKGEKNLSNEMEEKGEYIDDPNELIGKRFDYKMVIENAVLPENICTDVYAEYSLNLGAGNKKTFQTNVIKGRNPKPAFSYVFHHFYEKVDDEILKYLLNHNLCIQVYGIEEIIGNSAPSQMQPMIIANEDQMAIERNKNKTIAPPKDLKQEGNALRRASLKLDDQSFNENDNKKQQKDNKKEKKPGDCAEESFKPKYVVICGGAISGLGKGITISSVGMLLKNLGYRVSLIKIDPYLNLDAGTMNPYEHGEVFVLDDGGEVDLDLGNYERFLQVNFTQYHNMTTGKVYKRIFEKERRGEYLGKCVQVVPHVTNEIKRWIEDISRIKVDDTGLCPQIVLVEIGGTVGDLESGCFYEAIRQLRLDKGEENVIILFLSFILTVKNSGEQKTKPTQNGLKELRSAGLYPDFVLCRSDEPWHRYIKEKVALFASLKHKYVLNIPDVNDIMEVPIILEQQNFTSSLLEKMKLPPKTPDMMDMKVYLYYTNNLKNSKTKSIITIVGKYTYLTDAYLSILKSLRYAAVEAEVDLHINWVESLKLEEEYKKVNEKEYNEAWKCIKEATGILLPGGFGQRGILGKMAAAEYARVHKIPFLGVCYGFQLAAINFAREVLKIPAATSEELDDNGTDLIVVFMPESSLEMLGGTLRKGSKTTKIENKDTLAYKIYGKEEIKERHRHRYEINTAYLEILEKNGLIFTGCDLEKERMEIFELKDHPFYFGVQFHPEFKTKIFSPCPVFLAFVLASAGLLEKRLEECGGVLKNLQKWRDVKEKCLQEESVHIKKMTYEVEEKDIKHRSSFKEEKKTEEK